MGYKANIGSNLLSQAVRLVVGAVTSIVVARVLGPRGQGYVAYILLIFTLAGDYGHFGLNNAVMYFRKRSSYEASQLFRVNLSALGLFFLGLAAVLFLLRYSGLALQAYSWLYILGGALFVGGDLVLTSHQAWYAADERIVASNRFFILSFLLKSAAVITLWLSGALTPGSFFAVSVGAMLLNALLLSLRVGESFRPAWNARLLREEFAYGGVIWLGAACCFLLYRVDQFLVKQLLGVSQLGVYSVAVSLAELLFLIPLSLNSALLGKLYNTQEGERSRRVMAQTLKLSLYACGALALAGIPLSLLIPAVYGQAYSGAVPCTMLLLGGTVFAALAIVASQYFFTLGKPGYHLAGTLSVLLLNLGLNFLLIPRLGITGAALASALAYFCYGAYYLLLLERQGFSPRELFVLKTSELRDLWRS